MEENIGVNLNNKYYKPRAPKASGLPKGVVRNNLRYSATLFLEGERYYLGTFDTPEQAAAAHVIASEARAEGYKPNKTRPSRKTKLESSRVVSIGGSKSPLRHKSDNKPFNSHRPPNLLWTHQWIIQTQHM